MPILRPRQEQFVTRAKVALDEHMNTLGVGPTGFGKTQVLSKIVLDDMPRAGRALVLQHRDELVSQNRAAFDTWAGRGGPRSSVIDGKIRDPHGDVIYGMIQSVANNLEILPKNIGMVALDECHHGAAKSWLKVCDHIRETSPGVRILGVTATPERGDKKALTGLFNNVCDVVTLGELIRAGNLVRPRAMVIDLGVQGDLRRVKRTAADFDMQEVEQILDKKVHHDAAIAAWREHAGSRQTVAFCSTVAHSKHLVEAFRAAGISAEHIDGEMPKAQRKEVLARFDRGEFQVLSNVMVLTEGWDCQPVSCVMLLRPSSHASTMIQMIGRGLRKLDAERYPGRVKNDCVVLDFGTSLLTHGTLDVDVSLEPRTGGGKKKVCPGCTSSIPAGCGSCPICGHEFELQRAAPDLLAGEKETIDKFVLTEIDILNASPFRWEALFEGSVLVATSFSAWAMAIWYGGAWYAVGGSEAKGIHVLEAGVETQMQVLATCDDWMRTHGKASEAGKAKRWLLEPATPKQAQALRLHPTQAAGVTKYQAACHLTWKAAENAVKAKVMAAAREIAS